jgi:hypothetical protein
MAPSRLFHTVYHAQPQLLPKKKLYLLILSLTASLNSLRYQANWPSRIRYDYQKMGQLEVEVSVDH